jgi:hypothetical protein
MSQHEIPDTVQGKIDYANKLKEVGNEHFKKQEYKQAIKQYKTVSIECLLTFRFLCMLLVLARM